MKVFIDSHADSTTAARNWLSRNLLHKVIWRHCAHLIEPYTIRFYGVLPARVDFLKSIYKLPDEKCKLLIMGADDDKVHEANQPEIRFSIRKKYGIGDDDFLVMTGGKIDSSKKQILLLMQAIMMIQSLKVKLILFGPIAQELEDSIKRLCVENRIMHIGWVEPEQTYNYFTAADLVVFPGRHSVFWEQVAGLGIPMICKYHKGTTHIDLGGNVVFLYEDSAEKIYIQIEELINNPAIYQNMRVIAQERGMKTFSYRTIAEQSIL